MPRSRQQNQRIKDERRRQIMDAALKVFAQKGLAATMISDIAAASNLSYGLIYHYFHDKEEIYIGLIERALAGTVRLTDDIRAQPGSPWDRLYRLCGEMMQGARDTPEYFRIILQARLNESLSAVIQDLINRYSERIWGTISDLIREAQAAGEVVAGNPGELANVLSATIQGLSLNMAVFDDDAAFPSVETVMRFLRPDHPAIVKEPPHDD